MAATDYDVLFTDVGLPGMSGVELARKATRDKHALQVIFASGYGDVTAQTDFHAISLPKPYDFMRLQEVLDQLI